MSITAKMIIGEVIKQIRVNFQPLIKARILQVKKETMK